MWDKIKFFFTEAWAFLKPFATQLLTNSGKILLKSAMAAVTAVAANMGDSSGADKRDAALKLILADLEQAGIALALSTVNAALEAAVVKLKEGGE